MLSQNIVVMGQITVPFGVKGWIKLKVFTETPDSLLDYAIWWLNTKQGWQEYKVAGAEWRDSGLVAQLEGFNDRTSVEALKGIEIGIPRQEFPEPDKNEYYWTDLLGLEVINKQNESLGVVKNLMETGANDVLVVSEKDASNTAPVERLIPYIEAVVISVDLANRRILVDWGLDY